MLNILKSVELYRRREQYNLRTSFQFSSKVHPYNKLNFERRVEPISLVYFILLRKLVSANIFFTYKR